MIRKVKTPDWAIKITEEVAQKLKFTSMPTLEFAQNSKEYDADAYYMAGTAHIYIEQGTVLSLNKHALLHELVHHSIYMNDKEAPLLKQYALACEDIQNDVSVDLYQKYTQTKFYQDASTGHNIKFYNRLFDLLPLYNCDLLFVYLLDGARRNACHVVSMRKFPELKKYDIIRQYISSQNIVHSSKQDLKDPSVAQVCEAIFGNLFNNRPFNEWNDYLKEINFTGK